MTLDPGQHEKRMRLRYAGICRLCGAALSTGTDAIYERQRKTVRCVTCGVEPSAVADGIAGASARREHERRKNAREQRIRTNHPKLGGLILALSDDPQSTHAWEGGAIGEELLAERLKALPDSARMLHDRRIPGTRANIDHIVVTPSGVWVIDAKRYKDRRPSLQVQGGLIRPRVETLRVGGRDQTKLVDGVRTQVERVSAALAGTSIKVKGALCFVDADWPLVGGAFTVNDIDVLWPKLLIKRLADEADGPIDVDAIWTRLAVELPPA